ncbi:glutamine--fructose-6-phosphate transaminase (isomerizing) [Lentilitoribacter sp. EG35]|jgi:glucosamine--fructose-6-phosphate aminotransferase (isomerizing)|uniref:glutamine--fructose-6-phosphate transaminase (isomerizing) n=1 Tax=Lentilitoribacter sp. EG35 TaxID=3234192 RepID=UPI00345FA5E4
MCGIVGIVGKSSVAPKLVDALKRLEYRGYDSAGVATIANGILDRRRAEGKLVNLESCLSNSPLDGNIGIGHTRWATHGAPTVANAHPHFTKGVAVVHNGIIENFATLRDELSEQGAQFSSQTDTEVVAHLFSSLLAKNMTPQEAMQAALKRLEGAYALAVLFEDYDDMILCARSGPPLAVGHGDGEMFIGSDSIALASFTDDITYLEDGDWAIITHTSVEVHDLNGDIVERKRQKSQGSAMIADKGNYRHFMLKEIHEQPEVMSRTIHHYLDMATESFKPIGSEIDFANLDRLAISACGTAYYAGLIGKYWFERYARLPVEIDVASEFRYRELPLTGNMAAFFISQSGETADTLACLRYCKENGVKIGSIVNVPESTIARESDVIFPTLAGIEVGVASTKAFTCQLATLASLAISAGRARGTISDEQEKELARSMASIERLSNNTLESIDDGIKDLSRELAKCNHALYLGRGTNFPLAMEAALKLKEISYIHAEGYAAGELKHGPIALIDEDMPVITIAPYDDLFDKTVSNMQEVAARGGKIIFITDERGAKEVSVETMSTIVLPDVPEAISPMIYSLPIQLLAYHTAVFMGTDVDQPRNLAKSVTVE